VRHDELALTVIGAGPAYTDLVESAGAAYLVEGAGSAILLDLGQGAFPRLARTTEPSRLDAVVVSHLHPDHFVDLVPLRHYLVYEFQPSRRVRVLGPQGLSDRLDTVFGDAGFAGRALDHEDLRVGVRKIGGLELEWRLVAHTAESYAVRISAGDGPGLVYSGDCGSTGDLAPLVRRGDTVLVEVSFGPDPVPPDALHLNAPLIAEMVAMTRPGQILLTHLQMGFDGPESILVVEAAAGGAPVRLVAPGDRFTIGRPGRESGTQKSAGAPGERSGREPLGDSEVNEGGEPDRAG
jgi:ribonuclease BN (tRNA processing enzyme)